MQAMPVVVGMLMTHLRDTTPRDTGYDTLHHGFRFTFLGLGRNTLVPESLVRLIAPHSSHHEYSDSRVSPSQSQLWM